MTDDKIVKYIKQAFVLREEKCYKQAVEMLYKALEIENDNSEILFQIGELYFCMLDMSRAIQYLESVLKKNPVHVKSLRLLKDIYKREGKLSKAIETVNKLLEINKDSERDIISMIELQAATKNTEALQSFEKYESSELKVALANAYYMMNNLEKSEKFLNEVLQVKSENEEALLLYAKILFNRGELQKSREIIFSQLKYDTENPEILNYLGLFAMEDLDFSGAVQYFSKASLLNKEEHKYFYNLGNAYFLNGWFKEAVGAYLQAIRLDDLNLDYRYSLAYLYYKNHDFIKARGEVEYILSHDENHYKTRVLEALLLYENRDYLAAQIILENNLKLGADDLFTKLSLAKVYKELLNYDKAECILKTLEYKSDNLDVKYEFADILFRRKNFPQSIDVLKEILNQNDKYIKAYTLLSSCHFEIGNIEEAKILAQEAIAIDMNFASGYACLAAVREAEKDFDEAIECMKRAIMYNLNNAKYYAKMSDLYVQKENYSYAFEYIKEAVELDNSSIYKSKFAQLASIRRHEAQIS